MEIGLVIEMQLQKWLPNDWFMLGQIDNKFT